MLNFLPVNPMRIQLLVGIESLIHTRSMVGVIQRPDVASTQAFVLAVSLYRQLHLARGLHIGKVTAVSAAASSSRDAVPTKAALTHPFATDLMLEEMSGRHANAGHLRG